MTTSHTPRSSTSAPAGQDVPVPTTYPAYSAIASLRGVHALLDQCETRDTDENVSNAMYLIRSTIRQLDALAIEIDSYETHIGHARAVGVDHG